MAVTAMELAGQQCYACDNGIFEIAVLADGFQRKLTCSNCGYDPIKGGKPEAEVVETIKGDGAPDPFICQEKTPHMLMEEELFDKEYVNPIAARLIELAWIAEEKGREYGETHDKFGPVMKALFPEGIHAVSTEDWNRIGVINMIVHKLMRYVANMKNGGHLDSANDLSVYGAILAEVTKQ